MGQSVCRPPRFTVSRNVSFEDGRYFCLGVNWRGQRGPWRVLFRWRLSR